MIQEDLKLSPLYGLRIGSTVRLSNELSIPPVIEAGTQLTYFVGDEFIEKEMIAESSYVYTDNSSQTSIGGGVAIKGLLAKGKLSASVAWGSASADSYKSTKIDYQVRMVSGVQVINFNRITPEDLLNNLEKGPREAGIAALDAFNAYNAYNNSMSAEAIKKDKEQVATDRAQVEKDRAQIQADRVQLNVDRRKLETDRDTLEADKLLTPDQLKAAINTANHTLITDRETLEADRAKAKTPEAKKAIADREKAIKEREADLRERKKPMADREKAIDTKDNEIGEKDNAMEGRESAINERESAINEREKAINERASNAAKAEQKRLLSEWIEKVNTFFSNYGEGMVVGIVWGGIGVVSLKIIDTQKETSSKFDSAANLTVSTPVVGVSIDAAHGHSSKSQDSSIKTSVTTTVSGSCVLAQVQKWQDTVEGKAFSAISNISLLNSAPKLDVVAKLPTLPDFTTKAKDPKLADKFDKIDSMDGLEALSIAQGYDAFKKNNPNSTKTLEEYIKESKEKQKLPDDNISEKRDAREEKPLLDDDNGVNQAILLEPTPYSEDLDQASLLEGANDSEPLKGASNDSFSGFTPLGVWTSRWSDLFPWLAKGYSNKVDTNAIDNALNRQCMIQDFIALAKMYRYAKATGLEAQEFGIDNFDELAKAFQARAIDLQSNATYTTKKAYIDLYQDAKKIYDTWNDVHILRDAELGLGVQYIEKKTNKISSITGVTEDGTFTFKPCNFEGSNYEAFASFERILPIITPKKEIFAYVSYTALKYMIGPNGAMIPYNVDSGKIIGDFPLVLRNDNQDFWISTDTHHLFFYPIKLSAAKGVEWKGQLFSTNLGAMQGLKNDIDALYAQLRQTQARTFAGSNWQNRDVKSAYGGNMHPNYMGLVNEIKSVFPK